MTQVGHTWITADLPPTAFSGLHCFWTTEKNIQPVKKSFTQTISWDALGVTWVYSSSCLIIYLLFLPVPQAMF